jgi:hypothetical protein
MRMYLQKSRSNQCCWQVALSWANALSLLVCYGLQVNLMSYVKLSTYRDFRIFTNHLQVADNQDQSVNVSVSYNWFNPFYSMNVINQPETLCTMFGELSCLPFAVFKEWKL